MLVHAQLCLPIAHFGQPFPPGLQSAAFGTSSTDLIKAQSESAIYGRVICRLLLLLLLRGVPPGPAREHTQGELFLPDTTMLSSSRQRMAGGAGGLRADLHLTLRLTIRATSSSGTLQDRPVKTEARVVHGPTICWNE